MRILKRLIVWSGETSLEGLLLAVTLVSLFGCDEHVYSKCMAINFVLILTMFFATGYLFSTEIVRAIWRGPTWICSVIATALFLIQFEILNYSAGGAFEPTKRRVIRFTGVCIVFGCTYLGGLLLRTRPRAGGEQVG